MYIPSEIFLFTIFIKCHNTERAHCLEYQKNTNSTLRFVVTGKNILLYSFLSVQPCKKS